MAWRREKYSPKMHVIRREVIAWNFMLEIMAWCDQVTEAPDLTRIIVLRRGTFMGLNVLIRSGGQVCPISKLGLRLEWKYAQKNDEKNRISEIINRIIPIFMPFITIVWWYPCRDDSRFTSFHHIRDLINIIKSIDIDLILKDWLNEVVRWITRERDSRALMIGHGLIDTMWYGWNLFIIWENFVMV
jgi:hypothetical protein